MDRLVGAALGMVVVLDALFVCAFRQLADACIGNRLGHLCGGHRTCRNCRQTRHGFGCGHRLSKRLEPLLGTAAPKLAGLTLRHPLTTWLKILLGWSLGGLLLFWLLRHVDVSGIAQSAAKLPVWLWLFCTLLWLLSFVLRGRRVQQEWHWRRPVNLLTAMRLVLLHNAAVLVLPFRAGEAGYPLLVKHVFAAPLGQSLRSLMWLRIQDAAVLGLLLVWLWPDLHWGWPVLCSCVLVGLVMLPANYWLLLLKRRSAWARALRSMLHRRAPRSAWLLSLGNWVCKLSVVAILLSSLLAIPMKAAFQGALGGEWAGLLPLQGPAGLGTYEAGVWLAAGLKDRAAASQLPAAALLVHVFCLAVSLGAALLAWTVLRWPEPSSANGDNS